ncbi:RNA polymerase sigma factor [Hippea sp. KM1]|uniref:RNA polymerase sigma factor n=1 Tax=Hippea sp. KM1 TaxID=944481 RepID=UPI00046CD3D7|nr:sigma factor [Hippea sp. KM1]
MVEEILKRYLTGEALKPNEEEMLIKTIKTQAACAIRDLKDSPFADVMDIDDLVNETVMTIIKKRQTIIKAINNRARIEAYIKSIAKNHLIDQLRKKTLIKNRLKFENTQKPHPKNELISIEAEEFAKLCKKELTKTEKEALCLELLQKGSENRTAASFEKAKSRAHKRIKEFIEKERFSIDIVDAAIKSFFLSEICSEFVNLYEGRG